MKKTSLFFSAAMGVALLGAVVSNAHSRLKSGFEQQDGACVAVNNIPDNCTTTPATICTAQFANRSEDDPTQCVDQLYHP